MSRARCGCDGDLNAPRERKKRRVTEAPPIIAVVDDDDSVQRSLGRLLRALHYGVQVFGFGEEFLASGSADVCDCAVVDVRMPGIDGLELQERLAASHPKLPVILITGHVDPATNAQVAKTRAVALLHKPISQTDLVKAIHQALAGGCRPPQGGV